jgi:hypothetical protein
VSPLKTIKSPRQLGFSNASRSSSGARGLDDDLSIEVGPRAEAESLVIGARVAVRAGVEAAAVGVHAEAEAQVGAVVLGQDAARRVLDDLEPSDRRALVAALAIAPGLRVEVLHRRGAPRVRRVLDQSKARGEAHLGQAIT